MLVLVGVTWEMLNAHIMILLMATASGCLAGRQPGGWRAAVDQQLQTRKYHAGDPVATPQVKILRAAHTFHSVRRAQYGTPRRWWGVSGWLTVERYAAHRLQYVLQNQDNFDGSNTNSWLQAFYVNDSYWVPGSNAPVFLCVGGEGPPLDGSVVRASPHCNVAVEYLQETKALMFAVNQSC